FLDARQLMPPEPLELARPLMQRPNRLGVGSIEHLPAIATDVHQAHVAQHSEMLRNRWLLVAKAVYDIPDRAFLQRQVVENLPPPGFGNRVERIRSRRCSCHARDITFPYGNM